MGVVYEARQCSLNRLVALKVLLPQFAADTRSFSRFEREAKAAARLHHTNIVPVFGVGSQNGVSFYAMQFIDGPGLNQVIEAVRQHAQGTAFDNGAQCKSDVDPRADVIARTLRERPIDAQTPKGPVEPSLSPSQSIATTLIGQMRRSECQESRHTDDSCRNHYCDNIARLGMQAAEALSYAHQNGVTHRDIKPSNLLVDSQCTVWITDFGLAKAGDSDDITHTGDVVGTLRYLPPESFNGEADARSDVYALGLTLYELLALEPAYPGDDRAQVVKMITTQEPQDLRRRVPRIPRDLATIVHKAIEREPRRRYQSAVELYEDLRRFRFDEPILARPTTALERIARWSRRNRELAISLAGVATLLILISASAVFAAVHFREQESIQHDLLSKTERLATRNRLLLQENQEALSNSRQSEKELRVARTQAELLEEKTRQNLYTAQMILAHQLFGQHRGLARTRTLLDAWRPTAGERDFREWEWYFINSMCHRESFALSGHRDAVTGADWNSDGKQVATVGRDGTVRVWDAFARSELTRWEASTPCHCVKWSHSGDRLAVGGDDGLTVWKAVTGQRLFEVSDLRPVYGVSWQRNDSALAAAFKESRDLPAKVVVVDGETGAIQQEFEVTAVGTYTTTISWSADDRLIATPDGSSVAVLNVENGQVVHRLRPNSEGVQAVAFHPSDPSKLAVAGRDALIRFWNLNTRAQTATVTGHTHAIASIAWSPDGALLASAGWDGTARVWNATAYFEVASWTGHPRHCFSVCWHPDGQMLASAGDDNLIKVWNLGSSREYRDIETRSSGRIAGLCFDGSGQTVRARTADGHVSVWDASSAENIVGSRAGRTSIASCFDPLGRYLVCAFADGTVERFELPSQRPTASLSTPLRPITRVACRPDGAVIAIADGDGKITLWDTATKARIASFEQGSAPVWCMSWDFDGKRLAVGDESGTVRLWNTSEVGSAPTVLPGHHFAVSDLAWSSDGKRLTTASLDHTVRVWEFPIDGPALVLNGHNENVLSVSWSPDGSRLLSGDARGTLIVWDPATGQETLELRGRRGQLDAACWSPDGRRIAVSTDGHIMIWDATKGFEDETR